MNGSTAVWDGKYLLPGGYGGCVDVREERRKEAWTDGSTSQEERPHT